jgi:DNA-binding NtrC family response regulator
MRRPILDKKTAVQTGGVARAGNGVAGNLPSPENAAAMFSRLVESGVSLPEMKEAVEKWFVMHALETCQYNQTRAAKALGIHRNTLIRRLNEWGYNRKLRRFE